MDTRLYRSRDDRMLGGVAGGLADYLAIDPSLVRIGWVLLFLAGGVGLLLYIIMWIVVPEEGDLTPEEFAASSAAGAAAAPGAPAAPAGGSVDWHTQRVAEREARRAARRARRAANPNEGRVVGLVVGGFLVLVGFAFLLREFIPAINFDLFWPILLVLLGIVVLVAAFRPSGPGSGGRS
jgi:phage shock protein PspC (stress-responsive transcriptional regulator)